MNESQTGMLINTSHNTSSLEDEEKHELAVSLNTSECWVRTWLDPIVCKTKLEALLSLGE